MPLSLVMIVEQKILVALTLYLSGDSSKHEVYYNHCYVVSCSTEPRTRATQAIVPHMPRLTIM